MKNSAILCMDDKIIILESIKEQLRRNCYLYKSVKSVTEAWKVNEVEVERVSKKANLYACIAKPWSEAELVLIISNALG